MSSHADGPPSRIQLLPPPGLLVFFVLFKSLNPIIVSSLQLYIPSFMLVIVSWVSFWLDKDSVPARVTLGSLLPV